MSWLTQIFKDLWAALKARPKKSKKEIDDRIDRELEKKRQ